MAKRERLLPGCSTKLEKEAQRVQKTGNYEEWNAQNEKNSPPRNQEPLGVKPHTYYRTGDGIWLKGSELKGVILPINLQEANPSLFQRIKKELSLLIGR